MYQLKFNRPNTIGVTLTRSFESYADLRDFVDLKLSEYQECGWRISETASNCENLGVIELSNDNIADLLLIEWQFKDEEAYA